MKFVSVDLLHLYNNNISAEEHLDGEGQLIYYSATEEGLWERNV